MATLRGGNPPPGNGPSQAQLWTSRRYARACSRGLADHAASLRVGGYPSFANDLARVSWDLEKITDQMQARLEQP